MERSLEPFFGNRVGNEGCNVIEKAHQINVSCDTREVYFRVKGLNTTTVHSYTM